MPWDPPNAQNSMVVAIHAALVPSKPTGEIVYFAGFFGEDEAGRSFRYDCATKQVAELVHEDDEVGGKNLFCSGHAQLGDGRWLIGGGSAWDVPIIGAHKEEHPGGASGIRDCFVYLPRGRQWRRAASMAPQPGSEIRGGGRWYPTLVTLADGQVLAIGGHPLAGDADLADSRHNNNTPERYLPSADSWKHMLEEVTASAGDQDYYDRLHLAPSGHVFFSTLAKIKGDTRLFDPYTGKFANTGYGKHLESAYDDPTCSATTTSIILPILHGDAGHFWILTCGAAKPERIDLKANPPKWVSAGDRQPFPQNELPIRQHLLGILLPTGQVFVGCGMRPTDPPTGVMEPEIYTPAIDWTTGTYTDGAGTWQTLANEPAAVPRGYHSTALLQPDGTVWTAGSTHSGADLTNPDAATNELRIQIYRPNYGGSRPIIDRAPASITWGETFTVRMTSDAAVHRVALIRCGSFTHAFDGDQRYLTLHFTRSGSTLTVTAPHSSTLAPPGTYMLWVLRNETTPCQQAAFIRLAPQDHYFALELDTYSLLAVKALKKPFTESNEATFEEAIFLFYEGFLPSEVDVPAQVPQLSWQFSDGAAVPGMRIELARQGTQIDPVANLDTPQKFTFVYDVIFDNEQAFNTFGDDEPRKVIVRSDLNGYVDTIVLTLMKKANPFMKDGDPPWLSIDLRVHRAAVMEAQAAGGPDAYIKKLLNAFEASNIADDNESHPFELLDTSQDDNPVVLEVPEGTNGVHNFAVARVRYLSIPGEDANDVRVFFRLFNTVGTALEYDPKGTYNTLAGVAGPIPGLGRVGSFVTTIPFFAAPRVTPGKKMTEQSDDQVNKKPMAGAGPAMTYRYFGCWLDINTRQKHFPRFIFDDGPFGEIFGPIEGPLQEMVTLIAGYHQCLVAEISFGDNATSQGATPFTSDNLAQRNLATVYVANPGLEAITRTAQTSFEVKPSDAPTPLLLAHPGTGPAATVAARLRADELLFWRNNLPAGSLVEVYMPEIDVDEVMMLGARWLGPAVLKGVDSHTVQFELGTVTYLPLPGSRETPIVALLSVTLPTGIAKGQRYTLSVQQYAGTTRRFVGAFDLVIPVSDATSILPGETRKLSLLKYVFEAMPTKDRWYPVFERYLFEIGERVRGFGGNPESVEASPHGSGVSEPEGGAEPGEDHVGLTCATGKICEVHYDCFGDFRRFTLVDCDGDTTLYCASRRLEKVVLMAWREGTTATIHARRQRSGAGARHGATAANPRCPWSGKPVSQQALTRFEDMTVGFCSTEHRDQFERALARATRERNPSTPQHGGSADKTRPVNSTCPWDGRRVVRDAVVSIREGVIGFCGREHRDHFQRAVSYFRECAKSPAAVDAHPTGTAAHSINRQCPWTGKPVQESALTRFEGNTVGFATVQLRDEFRQAVDVAAGRRETAGATTSHPHGEHAAEGHDNHEQSCPLCDRRASPDVSASIEGGRVSFCTPEHRDRFLRAIEYFRECRDRAHSADCDEVVKIVLHC
jgi:hypothetical protein